MNPIAGRIENLFELGGLSIAVLCDMTERIGLSPRQVPRMRLELVVAPIEVAVAANLAAMGVSVPALPTVLEHLSRQQAGLIVDLFDPSTLRRLARAEDGANGFG